jgi:hypothetical protein
MRPPWLVLWLYFLYRAYRAGYFFLELLCQSSTTHGMRRFAYSSISKSLKGFFFFLPSTSDALNPCALGFLFLFRAAANICSARLDML